MNIKGKNYYFENSNVVTGWKNIDGVQYYFNADGSQGSSLVIDVSTYNGDIDWILQNHLLSSRNVEKDLQIKGNIAFSGFYNDIGFNVTMN